MNIEALSKQLGTSYRTVYRRISKAGLALEDLKDTEGQLTAEGVQAISALFDNDNRKDDVKRQYGVNSEDVSKAKALVNVKGKAAEKAIADAEKRASDAEARATTAETEVVRLSAQLDDLRRQLDDLRSDRDDWKRAAAESRALQMQQLQRLLPERVPFTQRVRRMFTRTNKGEE